MKTAEEYAVELIGADAGPVTMARVVGKLKEVQRDALLWAARQVAEQTAVSAHTAIHKRIRGVGAVMIVAAPGSRYDCGLTADKILTTEENHGRYNENGYWR